MIQDQKSRQQMPDTPLDLGLVQDAWVQNYLDMAALEQEYEELFELAPCGYITLTPDGRIQLANGSAAALLGSPSDGLPGTLLVELCDPDDRPALIDSLEQAKTTGHLQTVHIAPASRSEQIKRLRADIRAHSHDGGLLRQWQISLMDATETTLRIQELEAARAISALRMRELNHRVGNNLMVLSSLVLLKEHEMNGDGHMAEVRRQLQAIQRTNELMRINGQQLVSMRSYLGDLLKNIPTTLDGTPITIDLSVSEIELLSDQAVSVGSIVNELALNAIKHGFADTDQPRLAIRLEKAADGSHYHLEVSNSGAPIPEDVVVSSPANLGLQIVACCVDQLRGSFEVERAPHPVYQIRFPADEPHSRSHATSGNGHEHDITRVPGVHLRATPSSGGGPGHRTR
jgi:two-component sensor histidine kinase